MNKKQIILIIVLLQTLFVQAQQRLTMEMVVNELALESPAAIQQKIQYNNKILTYINYKRNFLPSFAFNVSPLSFNHSIKSLQEATSGKYNYVEDFVNNTTVGIGIIQDVGITGGTLSLSSNINILSEFKEERTRFSTNILTLSYNQQLFGGYKNYQFQKKITKNEYDNAIKQYCENIAMVQYYAAMKLLDLYLLNVSLDVARYNIQVADTLLNIGRIKFNNGALTEQQLLQLELQLSNEQYNEETLLNQKVFAFNDFKTYLGLDNSEFTISINDSISPQFIMYNDFFENVQRYNPFYLSIKNKQIQAEQNLYNAKMQNRFNADIGLSFGFNQYADKFSEVYMRPTQQQAISISLTIPMYNWGVNRNNQIIAENIYKSTLIDIKNEEYAFYNNLKEEVDSYNSALRLLEISKRSYRLSRRKYDILANHFYLGESSVSDLTNAYKELNSALQNYCTQLQSVWSRYFRIRAVSLYDYILDIPLETILIERYKITNMIIYERKRKRTTF